MTEHGDETDHSREETGGEILQSELQEQKTNSDSEPWWVSNPPTNVITSSDYRKDGNNCWYGSISIQDVEGKEVKVWGKVFDPDNKLTNSDKANHSLWCADVPNQQGLRKVYQELFPNEPAPILYSAEAVNQDGLPTIIQEVAPETNLVKIFEDETLSVKQRKEIYFTALQTYAHFILTNIEYDKRGFENRGYHVFYGDQHASDFRWDTVEQKLVLLDIQTIKRDPQEVETNSNELGFGNYTHFNDLLIPHLNATELALRKLIIFGKNSGKWKNNKSELAHVLEDFALGKLTDQDERLQINNEGLLKLRMEALWPRGLYLGLGLGDYTVGNYRVGVERLTKETPSIIDEGYSQEQINVLKALLLIMNARSENYDEFSEDPYNKLGFNEKDKYLTQVQRGYFKFLSGELQNDLFPEEASYRDVFLTELRTFVNTPINKFPISGKVSVLDLQAKVKKVLKQVS